MSEYAEEWLSRTNKAGPFSPLASVVIDALEVALGQVYHWGERLGSVDWSNDTYIVIPYRGGLHSYDPAGLTRLLISCFDKMLRLEINPRHFVYIELVFHRRVTRSGPLSQRLPKIDHFIDLYRDSRPQKGAPRSVRNTLSMLSKWTYNYTIEINPHKLHYNSITEYLNDTENAIDYLGENGIAHIQHVGTLVEMHVYYRTPISSVFFYGTSVEKVSRDALSWMMTEGYAGAPDG